MDTLIRLTDRSVIAGLSDPTAVAYATATPRVEANFTMPQGRIRPILGGLPTSGRTSRVR